MLLRLHIVFYSLYAQNFYLLRVHAGVQVRLAVCKLDGMQHVLWFNNWYQLSGDCTCQLRVNVIGYRYAVRPASSHATHQQLKTPVKTSLFGTFNRGATKCRYYQYWYMSSINTFILMHLSLFCHNPQPPCQSSLKIETPVKVLLHSNPPVTFLSQRTPCKSSVKIDLLSKTHCILAHLLKFS